MGLLAKERELASTSGALSSPFAALSCSSFALKALKFTAELFGVGSKPFTTLLGSSDVKLLLLGLDFAEVIGTGLKDALRSVTGG